MKKRLQNLTRYKMVKSWMTEQNVLSIRYHTVLHTEVLLVSVERIDRYLERKIHQ